ncbi:MAG: hypothetical protein ACOCRX_07940 [Candidatus Woesearchaeota archaeon]
MNKEDWIKAGSLSYKLLKYGEKKIKTVSSMLELVKQMEEKLESLDSNASFGFPINVSIDNCAAHDSAKYKDDRELTGLVKLDVGVDYNGAIGDNALTVNLSDNDYSDLMNASFESLNNAYELLKQNEFSINEISKRIESTMKSYNIKPVSNLMGHGLDIGVIHGEPRIPNIDTNINKMFDNNSFFAIEPFGTYGSGYVKEKGDAEIYSMKSFKPLRSRFARKISKYIQNNYDKKPFSKRWIVEEFGKGKTNIAFKQMKNKDMIKDYPPLVDDNLVSQFEYSFGIIDNKVIRLTK